MSLDKGFKIVLYAVVIIGRLRVPGTINGGGSGHDFSSLRKSNRSTNRTTILFVKKNLNCGYFDLKASALTALRAVLSIYRELTHEMTQTVAHLIDEYEARDIVLRLWIYDSNTLFVSCFAPQPVEPYPSALTRRWSDCQRRAKPFICLLLHPISRFITASYADRYKIFLPY
jgi:hypothetical protein